MRLTLVLLAAIAAADAYKILVVFPVPSKSHSNLGFGIVRALLNAGHEVTYVTPYVDKNPHRNLKQISVESTKKLLEDPRMRLTLVLLAAIAAADAYKILVVFPVPSKSHSNLGFGIVRALLNAGHEVTYVTPYVDKNPHRNLKQISVESTKKLLEGVDMTDKNNGQGLAFVKAFTRNITMLTMQSQELRDTLVKDNYDAVVTEWFFNDIQAGFAAILQCPWLILSSTLLHPHLEYLVDQISSPGVIPLMMNGFPSPMNFWQRLKNTAAVAFFLGSSIILEQPTIAAEYKEMFTPLAEARRVQLPNFYDAIHNVSVLFVNSHSSLMEPQTLPRNVVEIGGYHIAEEVPELPQDLKEIMDKSTRGVVYFSMGSVLKSSSFSEAARRELLQIFQGLPYTVLWKFEEELQDVPKNVHIRPWMPQASILAHPNTKVFISHGGLLSTLETVHYGVPMVAIPVFADQPSNAERAVRKGYAIKVDYGDAMVDGVRSALNEMLNNDRYYKTAKSLSRLFNNRPASPHNLIVHYTELAIESKGALHLRSLSLLYPWYQRALLDQMLLVLVIMALAVHVVKRVVKKCCSARRKVKTQ